MRKAMFVTLGGSAAILAVCHLVPACSSDSIAPGPTTDTGTLPETTSDGPSPTDTGGTDGGGPEATPGCVGDPGPGDAGIPLDSGTTDPTGGPDKFTLDMAMAGFPPGTGVIYARITTEKGLISCSIDTTNAPITAANFIGLARGTRPYKTSAGWVTGKFYDGLIWHRVIPDFVIQGGDPRGTGTGGPGYSLVNENHVVEPEGALAMAASALPSGSQYYITLGATGLKDYNLFGQCNSDVPKLIAAVPRDGSDKPTTPVHMQTVVIERCAK